MVVMDRGQNDAVPAISQTIDGTYIICGYCGEVLVAFNVVESINLLISKPRYCRKCGRAVKLE